MVAAVLAFDIGTSSVKAGLFARHDLSPIWLHREPLPIEEHELASWETEKWIAAVQACLDQLPPGNRIEAVALSGNGPTIVPVSRDGSALGNAMLWLDQRETRRGGQPSFFLPKVRWIFENEPKTYESTWQFMTCPEYLAFLMTSVSHSTTASAEFSRYIWDEGGIRAYEIDSGKLPPLVLPGSRVGPVDRRGAELFGLPEGVPVIAAGPDFLMSLLGTAAVEVGRTCDRAGTSEGINHCSDVRTDAPTVRCLPHVVPGLYNTAGVLSSTGRIFEWFRRISRQTSVGYERMLSEIVATGFDREPFFFPSVHEGAAWEFSKGMFVGLRADHATAEMGRGVVHSIGYAVRQSIQTLHDAGCEVVELRACGGQAKNPVWNQLKANMTGMPVIQPQVLDAELVGCSCCSLAGLGDADSPWRAANEYVRFTRSYEPDTKQTEVFDEGFLHYLDAYQRYTEAIRAAERDF